MSDYIQVQTTVANRSDALGIARKVVAMRLAGCVQITACTSVYSWQGAVEQDDEYLCTMKSSKGVFDKLKTALKELHPYAVPEIIATPITGGGEAYLSWLGEQLAVEDGDEV
ncbi:MAG: cytochrome C biogenesis protein CcdA [Desulfobulbus propionicus]|nr:MAG: cytochrome C biogenesis protein CcdA [Desulfobulbus propionicus]